MQIPKAALVDLDDTILDDSSSIDACWGEVCALAAQRAVGIEPRVLLAAIERQRSWFWSDPGRHRVGRLGLRSATREITYAALDDLGFDLPDLAYEIAERYRDLREERACLFPGAVEALERLRSVGVRLALITNGSADGQRGKIERFGLERHFDYILIEGEFGVGKPERQVYEATLAALCTEPSETWSVGDNLEWDVAAPQSLGMYGVWVDGRRSGLPGGIQVRPDRIIHSLGELL